MSAGVWLVIAVVEFWMIVALAGWLLWELRLTPEQSDRIFEEVLADVMQERDRA